MANTGQSSAAAAAAGGGLPHQSQRGQRGPTQVCCSGACMCEGIRLCVEQRIEVKQKRLVLASKPCPTRAFIANTRASCLLASCTRYVVHHFAVLVHCICAAADAFHRPIWLKQQQAGSKASAAAATAAGQGKICGPPLPCGHPPYCCSTSRWVDSHCDEQVISACVFAFFCQHLERLSVHLGCLFQLRVCCCLMRCTAVSCHAVLCYAVCRPQAPAGWSPKRHKHTTPAKVGSSGAT